MLANIIPSKRQDHGPGIISNTSGICSDDFTAQLHLGPCCVFDLRAFTPVGMEVILYPNLYFLSATTEHAK